MKRRNTKDVVTITKNSFRPPRELSAEKESFRRKEPSNPLGSAVRVENSMDLFSELQGLTSVPKGESSGQAGWGQPPHGSNKMVHATRRGCHRKLCEEGSS